MMKKFVVGLSMAILCAGCSTAQVNLAKTDDVSVRVIHGGAAKVVDVSASQHDDALVIKGRVERLFTSKVHGHIDFATYGNGGELIEQGSFGYGDVSRRRGKSRVPFTVQIPVSDKTVKVVYLGYHGIPHRNGEGGGCSANAVASKS